MIDYSLIDRSIQFYENKGFKRIESPWTVTKAISNITKPAEKDDLEIVGKNKVLVASGEQSFLYLYLKGFLPPGKFQTVTPCFRDDIFDITHTKYFIKNELIITDNVNLDNLDLIISTAQNFFRSIHIENYIEKVSDDRYDLMYDDIELGSYGIRSCEYLSWIYGTGIAEPRTSLILNMKKNGISY